LDVFFREDSVVDIMATMAKAITRELAEEIGYTAPNGTEASLKDMRTAGYILSPSFKGIINDTSNEVGRVHYGLLFELEIPEGFTPRCLEDELQTRGMFDVKELGDTEMESWSNLVIKHYNK
jgi:predicted NUDIX family phosphoesterase